MKEFNDLVSLIELGAAASTVSSGNQDVLNGLAAQKKLAKLVCEYEGLSVELKNEILAEKPTVEQEALCNVFFHIDPTEVKALHYSILLQISVESEGLIARDVARSLTRLANHPSGKEQATRLLLNLLKGDLQFTQLSRIQSGISIFPSVSIFQTTSYFSPDIESIKATIQHGTLIGLWDMVNPSDELKEIVLYHAKTQEYKPDLLDDNLVRCRAIETLGKWKLCEPEVISVIKQAKKDALKNSDSFLLKYSEKSLKDLGI